MLNNTDTGMTRERYFQMCDQLEKTPVEEEIPPDMEDFPLIVSEVFHTFNMLGDRIYPEIGYIGKDYTNLNHFLELYGIEDKEYFLELLSWLDARAIKKSSEELKREYDKMKRKNSGKRSQTNIKG